MIKPALNRLSKSNIGLVAFCLFFFPVQERLFSLIEQKIVPTSSQEEPFLTSNPLFEVASIGASTSGAVLDGMVGSIHKGNRLRFHCHSCTHHQGYLGPQKIAKPLSIKDQPGVFPAPFVGPAFLTFSFSCQNPHDLLTPIVIRPDGTIFQGFPMTTQHSPQKLIVAAPAQAGIYTLFALSHEKDIKGSQVIVKAEISSKPEKNATFYLNTFEKNIPDPSLISAEFIYTP